MWYFYNKKNCEKNKFRGLDQTFSFGLNGKCLRHPDKKVVSAANYMCWGFRSSHVAGAEYRCNLNP